MYCVHQLLKLDDFIYQVERYVIPKTPKNEMNSFQSNNFNVNLVIPDIIKFHGSNFQVKNVQFNFIEYLLNSVDSVLVATVMSKYSTYEKYSH